jgi:acylphosphatase
MTGEPQSRLEAVVRGRVQGVGYRWFVIGVAGRLGLHGWVANEPDGTVRCIAEGDRADLGALLDALRAGPPGSRVEAVEEAWLPATGGLEGFGARAGGHRGD